MAQDVNEVCVRRRGTWRSRRERAFEYTDNSASRLLASGLRRDLRCFSKIDWFLNEVGEAKQRSDIRGQHCQYPERGRATKKRLSGSTDTSPNPITSALFPLQFCVGERNLSPCRLQAALADNRSENFADGKGVPGCGGAEFAVDNGQYPIGDHHKCNRQ